MSWLLWKIIVPYPFGGEHDHQAFLNCRNDIWFQLGPQCWKSPAITPHTWMASFLYPFPILLVRSLLVSFVIDYQSLWRHGYTWFVYLAGWVRIQARLSWCSGSKARWIGVCRESVRGMLTVKGGAARYPSWESVQWSLMYFLYKPPVPR